MAILKIYNQIATESDKVFLEWFGERSVCYQNVEDFIASIPKDDDNILLKIDCRGGSVSEGWKIYDALRQTGKTISAEVNGICASMATIILLAAEQGKRTATEHSTFNIHEPFGNGVYIEKLTAEEAQKTADALAAEVQNFVDLYAERTTSSKAKIAELMKQDIEITAEEAIKYGLIDEIKLPLSANAENNSINNINLKQMGKNKMSAFLEKLALKHKLKAITLNTADGTELTIDRESGDPQVGDIASPDGEHLMPNGEIIVVVDGTITEIRPKATEEQTTTPATEEQIALLERRVAELESQLQASKANEPTQAQLDILNKVAIAGGVNWLNEVAKSNFKPEEPKTSVENKIDIADDNDKARYIAYAKNKTK